MGARLGSAGSSGTGTLASFSIGAGTNRALCVCVDQEGAGLGILTVNYGDAAMTQVVGIAVGDGTDNRVDLYYLNDAGIAGATGTDIVAVSAPTSTAIVAQAYEGVMQTTPTEVDSEALTGDSDPLTNIQISALLDGVTFGGGGTGNASGGTPTYAGTNPLSHLATVDASSSCCTAGDRISGGTETVNHNITYVTAPNRVSGAALFMTDLAGGAISDIDSDYGDASDEFDVDENSLDVNGSGFEASRGAGTVWLADETTLVASNAEVDLDAAVNTWGATEVNLNLTSLSAGDLADIEALIVSDAHALFVILVNDSAEEFSLPVTVHRAKAFDLSNSTKIAASGEDTTGQLTVPASGSFGGGRIQDDENPTDTVDLASDEFREDEWCFEALPLSFFGETYLFRVLIGGIVQGTITVTPGLTIEIVFNAAVTASMAVSALAAAQKTMAGIGAASVAISAVAAAEKAVTSSAVASVAISALAAAEKVVASSSAASVAISAVAAAEKAVASSAVSNLALRAALAGVSEVSFFAYHAHERRRYLWQLQND